MIRSVACVVGAACLLLNAAASARAAPAAAPMPLQRWWGPPDFPMFMLVPAAATRSRSTAPIGADMSPGWRLDWDGSPALPGTMVVRLQLAVAPAGQPGRETEVLQIGASRDPAAVASCLSYGLDGPDTRKRPDRTIGGQRFAVRANRGGGMSQAVDATDLRIVRDGACYAVERFSYLVTAAPSDPAVTLSADAGAQALDAALSSLRLGRVRAGNTLEPSP